MKSKNLSTASVHHCANSQPPHMLGPKMLSKLHIGSHLRLNRAHTSVLGHLPRGSNKLVAQIIKNHSPSDLLHSNVDIPPTHIYDIRKKKHKHIIGGCVSYKGWAEPPKILIPLRHLFLMHGQMEPANPPPKAPTCAS